jgi:hypothetical protein
MFKKFQNNSRYTISAVSQGKRIIIKPGEIVSGPDELSQYNGLAEVTKKTSYSMDITPMNILDMNRAEVDATIDLVNNLDTTKSYTGYQKKPEHKTFSIITLTHNKKTYIDMLNTLKIQETNSTFELIPVFNHQNEFKSCAQALNHGMSLANSDYYIITHQDLLVPKYWIQKFKEHFDRFEKQHTKLGFIGIAGTGKTGKASSSDYGALYLSNSSASITGRDITFATMMRQQWGSYKEVQCLDECAMACRADLGIKYDEVNFDHYHFYGADICLYAISKGYKNFAIDSDCIHLSDGQQNLVHPAHQKSFLEHGSRLFKKWRDKIPYFRTTTSAFYGPEKIWSPLIFQDVNRKYGTKVPLEIRVM